MEEPSAGNRTGTVSGAAGVEPKSDDAQVYYPDEIRHMTADALRRLAPAMVPRWQRRLVTAGAPPAIIDGLIRFFPYLCNLVDGLDRHTAYDVLDETARRAYETGVPYVRISRGLRLLKRRLMQVLVANLPAGHDRDQACDLVEEEIDEARVRVNGAYHSYQARDLRESAALTRFLLNNTHDAIFVVDVESGRIDLANAIAVTLTDYSLEQLGELEFTALVPAHRTHELRQALRRVQVSGALRRVDMPLVTRQGTEVPSLMQFIAVPGDDEQTRVQISVRDLSRESAALAAHEQEAAFLRAFVTDTADAVVVLDLENRILSWNKGAEQIFGYAPDEILNRPNGILVPPDLIESGELPRLDAEVSEQGYVRNYATSRLTKDGRRLDVEMTRTAIHDSATGERVGTSVVVRDVTEKRRLEREAARKTQQLEAINRILEHTSRSLDRDQTFRAIAAQIEGLLPCDAMTVCLPEAELERLRCRVLIGSNGLVVGSETLVDREDTVHSRVLATRRSLRLLDLADLARLGAHDRHLSELGYRSALVSPLVYNNEAMGSLMLLSTQYECYDEGDQSLLDHLANHFAVILENARRFDEERKRSAQFELISRVGAAAIANIGDVNRLMRSVVDTIQTDFGYYDVAIYEVDEQATAFRLRAQAGSRRGALGEGYEQPLDVGVFGEVLRTQTSYVCSDTRSDTLYFDPAPHDPNVRSELCVPIRLGPRVFGVLDVESQRPNRFDRLDRTAMEALASLLARCMEADESLLQTRMLQSMRHTIMEAVPSALILLDQDLRVQFVNRRYLEFFGQHLDEIMDRPAEEVFPHSLLEESRFFELVRRLEDNHRPVDQSEVRYFDFTGAERYVDVRMRIVTEYETTIIVMLHDATNRLTRLYQLSMLQEIGEEMQSTLDVDRLLRAILTCVTAGPGFGFNRAALFLFDPSARELVECLRVGPASAEEAGTIWQTLGHKKSLREFLREYDRRQDGLRGAEATRRAAVALPLAEGAEQLGRWRTPIMLRADDHDSLPLARALREFSGASEALVVPLISQESVLGLIVADNLFTGEEISRDSIRMLTTFANQAGMALANAQAYERLALSVIQLREAQEELKAAERLAGIGSVAAHVAHEIRNPLVSIGGFARRLADRPGDPDYVRSRSGIILKEVHRLETILKNVADFTTPGAPKLAPVALNQVVKDVVSLQQPVFEETRTQVEYELAPELPVVLADSDQIKQVALNLVRNAVQAMGTGGHLMLTTALAADGEGVEARVIDQGPGIAADRLEEIFNPFFTNKADGTGLGLAVSRKIVSDHGGTLTVESVEGQGATFTITLPLPTAMPTEVG